MSPDSPQDKDGGIGSVVRVWVTALEIYGQYKQVAKDYLGCVIPSPCVTASRWRMKARCVIFAGVKPNNSGRTRFRLGAAQALGMDIPESMKEELGRWNNGAGIDLDGWIG
ncbi:hypothetical protein H1235_15705 [Pseudoxanthomonas sp. NC8]|nr:hypothetical protein H1235_15705 [Pseudoxanthomonas sp. NC8]